MAGLLTICCKVSSLDVSGHFFSGASDCTKYFFSGVYQL